MIEFFKTYISASSPTRAKIAIYLYAQSCAETKEKAADLLKGLKVESEISTKIQTVLMQHEKRRDTQGLKAYLAKDLKLSEDQVAAVIEAAKDLERPKVNGIAENGTDAETSKEAVVITDVRAFRASLVASPGALPAKDMSEYEELDSKL